MPTVLFFAETAIGKYPVDAIKMIKSLIEEFKSSDQETFKIIYKCQNTIILWCTGMSGSGETTLSSKVKELLIKDGLSTIIIDGDEKRGSDNKKLSFGKEDIIENNLSILNRYKTILLQLM